ncbi:PREDICTED: non-specific lipid transfer protein GPI-anchored 2 [Tarenaya hassleriana]|uniref:non-specific lipid transfer protein GPI-anchored 2 n=1 Tax=Tarenaya hassleriana TaxID=28532 RepID=UPI0008FCE31A|nr:PREDICTED: non-specific lipid transfer protein GPI-anchored 2 [Tarenaya hassleriana]
MSDCLSYVMAGSGGGASKPDAGCCPELAGLVESSPQCLCYLLGGNTAEQYGIKIDMAKALKLPSVCGVVTPPPSLCSLFGVPVAAPTTSEAPSSNENIAPTISPGVEPPQGFAASPAAAGDSKSDATTVSTFKYLPSLTTFALISAIYLYI